MQAHARPRRRLRLVQTGWAGIALATGLLTAYLATHHSEDPTWFGRYSASYLFMLIVLAGATIGSAAACLPRVQARWREPLKNALLLLASTLTVLAATEALLRATDLLGISYYDASARYQRDKLADPELGFRHRPNHRATYGGIASEFNALGMRDRPVAAKAPGEFRILALGDSVTFGWGTVQPGTFTERLEWLLGRALHRPVAVLNTGVGGYNTVQELGVFRQLGPVLQPDLLLLTYVSNDVDTFTGPFDPWSGEALEGKSPPEALKVLLGRLWLFRLVSHVARYGDLAFSPTTAEDTTGRTRGWRDSMASLRELARAADDAGIPLVVVFFRSSPQAYPTLLADVTATVAPVPVVDTAPWYAGQDVFALTNSRVDSHPNRQGHALLAEGIANYLLASGLIRAGAAEAH